MAKERKINTKVDSDCRYKKGHYKPIPLQASKEISSALKKVYLKYYGKLSNDTLYLITVDQAFHEAVYQNAMGSFNE